MSGEAMKTTITERDGRTRELTEAQVAQLRALEGRVPDTKDVPPAPDENWATAVRGKHHAAMQGVVPVRLDAEVAAWLRGKGRDTAGEIVRILRERMQAESHA